MKFSAVLPLVFAASAFSATIVQRDVSLSQPDALKFLTAHSKKITVDDAASLKDIKLNTLKGKQHLPQVQRNLAKLS